MERIRTGSNTQHQQHHQQQHQQQQHNYDLSVTNIPIEHGYVITKASIGQLMSRLFFLVQIGYQDTQLSANSNSEYHNLIYKRCISKFFSTRLNQFVQKYEDILKCENSWENAVKDYNIGSVGLPKGMIIPQKINGTNKLSRSKIGDIIQAVKQRADFIINREVPTIYDSHEDHQYYRMYFVKMQDEIKQFWPEIESFESDWIRCIDKAKKAQYAFDIKNSFYKGHKSNRTDDDDDKY